jgi:hypothetical protein
MQKVAQVLYGDVHNIFWVSLRRHLLSGFKEEMYVTSDGNALPGCVFLVIIA